MMISHKMVLNNQFHDLFSQESCI